MWFFFVKQKTAYEMRISDWSSDVCSSDLHQIPIPRGKHGEPPYSTDANLLHISYEGRALEDPWVEPDEEMYTRSVAPEKAPDTPEYVEIDFEKGDPVAVNGERRPAAALLARPNGIGGRNGVRRSERAGDHTCSKNVRCGYETP